MRRAVASGSSLLRGLQGSSTAQCSSGAGMVARAFSTQEPITATLFPGDGEEGSAGCRGAQSGRRPPGLTRRRRCLPPLPAAALCRPASAPASLSAPPCHPGIGPEIAQAVVKIFEAAEAPIKWDWQIIGKEVDPRTNSFVTRENLDSVLVGAGMHQDAPCATRGTVGLPS